MTVALLVFCAMTLCFLIGILQILGGEFLLPSSEKKTGASAVSGTFRNFYMTARCDMPEGSKLFVL